MKKILMAILFALAGAVQADYVLWWDLDFTDASDQPWGSDEAPEYVRIVARKGGDPDTYLTFLTRTEYGTSVTDGTQTTIAGQLNGYATTITDEQLDEITGSPTYWFTVELGLSSGAADWISAGKTWAELQAYGAVANIAAGSETVGLSQWVPDGWAVPEPSSGLLLVLGGALLALRRRTR